MARRKHRDGLSIEEALARLFYSSNESLEETSEIMQSSIAETKELVFGDSSEIKRKKKVRKIRKKILSLHYEGKSREEISKLLKIKIGRVYKIINRYECLDDINSIKIIPAKAFPYYDTYDLLPIHRERLENLRRAKIEKYLKLQKEESQNSETSYT